MVLAYGTVAFEAPVLEFFAPALAHSGVELLVPEINLCVGAKILRSADHHHVADERELGVAGASVVQKRDGGPKAGRMEPGVCRDFLLSLDAFMSVQRRRRASKTVQLYDAFDQEPVTMVRVMLGLGWGRIGVSYESTSGVPSASAVTTGSYYPR